MTLETFIQSFEYLADARNGVQRLRELIFQLAIQGRLVSQDTNDEPVSVLLNRIKEGKRRLIKEGRVRRQDSVAAVKPSHAPYELPTTWLWVRVDSIANRVHYGYTASARESRGDVLFLRITDIQNDTVDWSTVPECAIDEKSVPDYELSKGDILIARTGGTIGKSYLVARVPRRAVFASYLIRIVPSPLMCAEYLKVFLGSPLYWSQLYEKSMGTGQPNVNGTALRHLIVPLPPLAEQERIVARVNELIEQCDDLERRQKERSERGIALTASCFHALAFMPCKSNATARSRVFDNFNLLIDTPESVAELRKAILQLAVQGCLVPQNFADEPASSLVLRIEREKATLIKENKNAKQEFVLQPNPEEVPFELPSGWTWTRLVNLSTKITDGEHLSPKRAQSGVMLLTAKHVTERGVSTEDPQFVSENDALAFRQRCDPERGDVLICSRGTIGRCTVVNIDDLFCLMGSVILVKPSRFVIPDYVVSVLRTTWAQEWMLGSSGATAVKALYIKDMRLCPIPLPPLPEQARIAEKINTLMGLCDELEGKFSKARNDVDTLMAAFVHHLCNPKAEGLRQVGI